MIDVPKEVNISREMPAQKSTPAYKGARFDAKGFCLTHSTVRLCKLTSNGRYQVVRKCCWKCGHAALMSDPHTTKTNAHGYKKKTPLHRDIPSDMFATSGEHRHHDSKQHTTSPKHTSKGHHHRSRARTLSPRREFKTVKARTSPKKKTPLSSSHTMGQKIPNEKTIKDLMQIKLPFSKLPSKGSGSDHSDHAPKHHDKKSSQGVGHCHAHPEVKLGIWRTMEDKKWAIATDECPLCLAHGTRNIFEDCSCPHKKQVPTASPLLRKCTNEDLNRLDSHQYSPKSSPRSVRATIASDDYFSRALVIYDEEDALAETVKHKNCWKMPPLPLPDTRLAKANKKHREHSKKTAVYDAWDALPV